MDENLEIMKTMHIFGAICETLDHPSIGLNALISVYFKICHQRGLSLEEIRDSFQECLIIFSNKIKDGLLNENPGVNL
jgi:hypothetical protein